MATELPLSLCRGGEEAVLLRRRTPFATPFHHFAPPFSRRFCLSGDWGSRPRLSAIASSRPPASSCAARHPHFLLPTLPTPDADTPLASSPHMPLPSPTFACPPRPTPRVVPGDARDATPAAFSRTDPSAESPTAAIMGNQSCVDYLNGRRGSIFPVTCHHLWVWRGLFVVSLSRHASPEKNDHGSITVGRHIRRPHRPKCVRRTVSGGQIR